MELLERYLQAIRQHLSGSAAVKADTLAELRANLMEEMDERAEAMGRPLTEDEVAAVLKAHGRPEVVALRYLPQRSLIGPTIYPFYVFTLKKTAPLFLLAYVVAEAATLIFGSEAGLTGKMVGRAVAGLIPAALVFWGCVTGGFAAFEWIKEKQGAGVLLPEWDPRKLPSVRADGEPKPRSTAMKAVDLAVHCLWMIYVLAIPAHPFWILGPGVFWMDRYGIALAPVWHTFYGLLVVLLCVQLAIRVMAFVPRARAWMKPLDLATNVLGLVALGWLCAGSTYFVAAGTGANLETLASVNHGIGLAMRVAFVAALAGLFKDAWKYAQRVRMDRAIAFL